MTHRQQPLFPVEVVLKTAFFIAEISDLLAFLEALRPAGLLGPLEHLWQLRLVKQQKELWPTLEITKEDLTLDAAFRKCLAEFAKCCSRVRVHNVRDIQWLRRHLPPTVDQNWEITTLQTSPNISNDWSKLRITSSHVHGALRTDTSLEALQQLKHLTTLIVVITEESMSSDLEFAAKSERLIHLELRPAFKLRGKILVNNIMLNNLIKWFKQQPVGRFHMSGWDLQFTDIDVKWVFYESMFQCASLKELSCFSTVFSDIDFSKLTFSMNSLSLRFCDLDSHGMTTLSTRLISSTVINFALSGVEYGQDFLQLFEILPQTSVKDLNLSAIKFHGGEFRIFANLLKTCTVETLTFRQNNITPEEVLLVAEGIRENKSIRFLNVQSPSIGIEEAKVLIKCSVHPKRRAKMHSLDISGCWLGAWSQRECLRTFAAEHGLENVVV
ncbi:hypothetical protein Ae201684P_009440 [Aphanomyces euteiches]|uniref:F-box domain-containing protein n=1 Tax=Aphanomyces euteiches TaxID=100861 RepID=A0A6G0WL23_9STRA|nr:hypothetical protein Ae201684_014079 [Aphanomyces euteiches]KAH9096203.1 hypothetical protein Ae201684P_009440 [Aphanomyces euteiches]